MIPIPRPGSRHGDCLYCGQQHQDECHYAKVFLGLADDLVSTPAGEKTMTEHCYRLREAEMLARDDMEFVVWLRDHPRP